jgi:hypothetical protein
LQSLDQIGSELSQILTERRPKILLNQISDENQKFHIKAVMDRYFDNIEWLEIPPTLSGGEWAEYRSFKPKQLLTYAHRVLGGMHSIDINVCNVSCPVLYNMFAGRFVVLIDNTDNGIIERNAPWSGMLDVLVIVFQGFKRAYSDLPHSLRSLPSLNDALLGGGFFKKK